MNVRGRAMIGAAMAGVALSGSLAAPATATVDEILPTEPNGVTYIRTESGSTLCGIERDHVSCTVQFANPPLVSTGDIANSVSLNENGTFSYLPADLGVIDPPHLIRYGQTYVVNSWAVEAFSDGTRFTNNRTNKGFLVSVTEVKTIGQL